MVGQVQAQQLLLQPQLFLPRHRSDIECQAVVVGGDLFRSHHLPTPPRPPARPSPLRGRAARAPPAPPHAPARTPAAPARPASRRRLTAREIPAPACSRPGSPLFARTGPPET